MDRNLSIKKAHIKTEDKTFITLASHHKGQNNEVKSNKTDK